MNSALQALMSSDIMNGLILKYIQKNPKLIDKLSPVLIEYCKLIIDLNKTSNSFYSPNSFKHILGKENSRFSGYGQQDSNELITYLVNEFTDEKRDKDLSTLIKNSCFGKFNQYIYCTECKKINKKEFSFLDVILPIPEPKESKTPDLEECFKKFAKYELIDGDNAWNCPNCKKKVSAYKKMEIEAVPDVAIFTFSRFKGTQKNSTTIEIYENIKLEDKNLKLIATVNHYGSTGGGHYVANVMRNGKWYLANDSNIKETKVDTVLKDPSVYVMVYQLTSSK